MTSHPVTMQEVMMVFDRPYSWDQKHLDEANNREYVNLVLYLVRR